jgi:hypothetical protein
LPGSGAAAGGSDGFAPRSGSAALGSGGAAPGSDGAAGPFDDWVGSLITYLAAHLSDFGLVAADLTEINAKKAAWDAAYADVEPKKNAYHAAVDAKDEARRELELLLRALVRRIQANRDVAAASKTAAGLPVYDTTPTPGQTPTSAPTSTVDTSQRLRHIINFRDENTPAYKAKPAGVYGCEIWYRSAARPPPAPTICGTRPRTPPRASGYALRGAVPRISANSPAIVRSCDRAV